MGDAVRESASGPAAPRRKMSPTGWAPTTERAALGGGRLPVVVLCAVGVLASLGLVFLYIAPNRLLSGHAASPHIAVLTVAWLLAAAAGYWRGGVGMAMLLTIGLPFLAAHDATVLLQHAPPTTRIQLGAGFWVMWLAAALLLLDRLRHLRTRWRVAAWLLVAVAFIGGAMVGAFNDLGLVREWQAQRGAFADALATHVTLSLVTLGLALVAGTPLGYLAWRRRRTGG